MARQFEAIYEQWILRPLEPLILLASVSAEAQSAGAGQPFFARVPRNKDVPFGGW